MTKIINMAKRSKENKSHVLILIVIGVLSVVLFVWLIKFYNLSPQDYTKYTSPTTSESDIHFYISIVGYSIGSSKPPIQFLVIDPKGLKTGYIAPTGTYIKNIPHSS